MKPLLPLLAVVTALILISCSDDSTSPDIHLPAELLRAVQLVDMALDTLEEADILAASQLATVLPDTVAARPILQAAVAKSPLDIEYAFITTQGIMQVVEPARYLHVQGSDISGQEHIIRLFQTRQPVLSATFRAVEGFHAAVMAHPVLKGTSLLGGVTALFFPGELIHRVISPLITDKSWEIWVMEKGGRVLWDQDSAEIGLNVITDSLYQPFTDLVRAAKEIDSTPSGRTEYTFFSAGSTIPVRKLTYWATIVEYGMEWKVVWVKPIIE